MPDVGTFSPVFVAIAVIFVVVALQSQLQEEGKLTPSRKTWLRIAIVFSVVGIALAAAKFWL